MSQDMNKVFEVDARNQTVITEEQVHFFKENGYLIIRNVIVGEELSLIQQEMMGLVEIGAQGVENDSDYMYGKGFKTGEKVFRRVEYVINKSLSMKILLGHPFILNSVEKLQGNNFIPTYDSMVLKMPNEGILVPWHRDAEHPKDSVDSRPIFNVDFYLDPADEQTCLWVIPGSNLWTKEQADDRCKREGFITSDAIKVPMNAGDVILHDIKVLHGSPSGDGNPLRRTIYYEFRPGEIEWNHGPHNHEYLKLKQQVLIECIKLRKQASYCQGEQSYEYHPSSPLAVEKIKEPDSFKYPHENYWI